MSQGWRYIFLSDDWQHVAIAPEVAAEVVKERYVRYVVADEIVLAFDEYVRLRFEEPPEPLKRRTYELNTHTARADRGVYVRAETLPAN